MHSWIEIQQKIAYSMFCFLFSCDVISRSMTVMQYFIRIKILQEKQILRIFFQLFFQESILPRNLFQSPWNARVRTFQFLSKIKQHFKDFPSKTDLRKFCFVLFTLFVYLFGRPSMSRISLPKFSWKSLDMTNDTIPKFEPRSPA